MRKFVSLLSVLVLVISCFAGCGKADDIKDTNNTTKQNSTTNNDSETRQVTVMVPPWAEPSAELLAEFTAETGIEVTLNVVGWDEIRDKVSIAAIGKKAPADVIEVDWSWVGEFYSAGWLDPIEMSKDEKANIPTISSFIANDEVIAIPYANDYRMAYYNTEHFETVGVTEPPKNWEEVVAYGKKIKEAGLVEYPISITLSATEAATTSLIWLTLSRSGDMFNADGTLHKENVMSSLNFIKKLVTEDKLIDPAMSNMKDVEAYRSILTGSASYIVGPTYFIGLINDEDESQVVGKALPALVPGSNGTGSASFALPEAIGIPTYAENKEEAREFINWYTSDETQLKMYDEQGNIPTRTTALQRLIDEKDIIGGITLIKQSTYIQSPFPGGIPSYYSEMSNAIFNNVNSMVQGSITPEKAFDNMDKKIKELSGN